MNIFVAGASGAIGRPLIERLVAAGHTVTGMSRSEAGLARLRALGAEGVVVDAFDRASVQRALDAAGPEIVIDQLTSLPQDPAGLADALPGDRHLRLEGGGHLFAAAEALGVRRYIQQSSGFFLKAEHGLADDEAPLRLEAPGHVGGSATMYDALERRVLGSTRMVGVALRYGFFYGPSTWYWPDGGTADQVRRQALPIIGAGQGVWSFVHIDDAAAATVAALMAEPGRYNIVDDEPITVADWLARFAAWLGAPPPPRVSVADAEAQAGIEAVYYQTRLSGAANAKAKVQLGFRPVAQPWRA